MEIIQKELNEIAWNVTEDEYRADPALSYSAISTFDREGVEGLSRKVEGYAIDFGSLVDTMLTEKEKVKDNFIFTAVKQPTDVMKLICDDLVELNMPLSEISTDIVHQTARARNYGAENWKKETVHAKVMEAITPYMELQRKAKGKTVMGIEDKVKAQKWVEAMLEKFPKYFNPGGNMRVYFQLKFKNTVDFNQTKGGIKSKLNVPYRSMFDLIFVDYEKKIIYPKDIKSSGKRERDFIDSFFYWRYLYQAQSYVFMLKCAIKDDPYFKDFTIADFSFLIANRDYPVPFEYTVLGTGYSPNDIPRVEQFPVVYNNTIIQPWYITLLDLYKTLNLNNTKYKFSENGGEMFIDLNAYRYGL